MKDKKQNTEKSTSPLAALATGVVIGAGVAVAGAVALNDKKNREKVIKVVKDVKNQVSGYMDDMQKTANQKKDEGKETVTQSKKEVKKATKSSIDSAEDKLEDIKKSI
jgi:gas vesicle protein